MIFWQFDYVINLEYPEKKVATINLGFICRQEVLGQFSMVNLELFNIVEDIKKVSKAFVVHPRNVNAENATSMLFCSIIGCK